MKISRKMRQKRKRATRLPNKLQDIAFSKSLPGQYQNWKSSQGTFGAASECRQIMKDGKPVEQ